MVQVRPDRQKALEEAGAEGVRQPPADVQGHADENGEEAQPPCKDDGRDVQVLHEKEDSVRSTCTKREHDMTGAAAASTAVTSEVKSWKRTRGELRAAGHK